jgi:hypothetical protein
MSDDLGGHTLERETPGDVVDYTGTQPEEASDFGCGLRQMG